VWREQALLGGPDGRFADRGRRTGQGELRCVAVLTAAPLPSGRPGRPLIDNWLCDKLLNCVEASGTPLESHFCHTPERMYNWIMAWFLNLKARNARAAKKPRPHRQRASLRRMCARGRPVAPRLAVQTGTATPPPDAAAAATMSQSVSSAMQSWALALESSHRELRGISAQLEADFERTYCHGAGASSATLNPGRLVARLARLEAVAPAAADAVLALAHTELEAVRAAKAAAARAVEAASVLDAVTPQIGGGDSLEGDVDEGDGVDAEIALLCARLASVAADTTREHSKLVSAESKGTDDYVDRALLKAGLSSTGAEEDGDEESGAEDGGGDEDGGGGRRRPVDGGGAASRSEPGNATTPRSARKNRKAATGRRRPSGKENASSGRKVASQRGVSKSSPASSFKYAPIAKPEYQRLPRMLKQQARLEELNDVYAKSHELLSAHTAPMPEAELLAACGEDSDKRIDVLRRGFSLLRRDRDGWSLGKRAPPQTVGRSRPPLDPASADANRPTAKIV
jgi:hypothetical protein